MLYTTIVIIEQERGESDENVMRAVNDIKEQANKQGRTPAETGFTLIDGRKKITLVEFVRIEVKKQIVSDAMKIIDGVRREGENKCGS